VLQNISSFILLKTLRVGGEKSTSVKARLRELIKNLQSRVFILSKLTPSYCHLYFVFFKILF
jgi:hypothetical protein